MTRRHAFLFASAGVAALRGQADSIDTLDLIPSFLQMWSETAKAKASERTQRFLEQVVRRHAELFEGFTGPVTPERAGQYLIQVERFVPEIAAIHKSWAGGFGELLAAFRRALPDFAWRGTVVLMPNLFVFDGGGGSMNGRGYLIFGLDTIARRYGSQADLSVLITHELFHLYHGALHPEPPGQSRGKDVPLFRLIWLEGLATYASQQLCPKASTAAVLLSSSLAAECEARLAPLASLLQRNLDAAGKAPFMEWMSGQDRGSEVPPRAGYYFGWRVAQALGRERTLPQLAQLEDVHVRQAMIRELEALANRG